MAFEDGEDAGCAVAALGEGGLVEHGLHLAAHDRDVADAVPIHGMGEQAEESVAAAHVDLVHRFQPMHERDGRRLRRRQQLREVGAAVGLTADAEVVVVLRSVVTDEDVVVVGQPPQELGRLFGFLRIGGRVGCELVRQVERLLPHGEPVTDCLAHGIECEFDLPLELGGRCGVGETVDLDVDVDVGLDDRVDDEVEAEGAAFDGDRQRVDDERELGSDDVDDRVRCLPPVIADARRVHPCDRTGRCRLRGPSLREPAVGERGAEEVGRFAGDEVGRRHPLPVAADEVLDSVDLVSVPSLELLAGPLRHLVDDVGGRSLLRRRHRRRTLGN